MTARPPISPDLAAALLNVAEAARELMAENDPPIVESRCAFCRRYSDYSDDRHLTTCEWLALKKCLAALAAAQVAP